MRIFLFLLLSLVISSCDNSPANATPRLETPAETTGSFRNRRGEVGAEILEEMEKQGIEFWINEDGSVGYYLVDGDAIDAIAYYARGKYAARN